MTFQSEIYEHSGKPGLGFLLPVVGILGAGLSALVYSYVNVYSPIGGYISILFVGLLAAGAAFPLAFAAVALKCRSNSVMLINAIATGLIALYLAWAFFGAVFVQRFQEDAQIGLFYFVSKPGELWELIEAIAENGWYSIRSATPSGIVLWIFWLIEAVIVIGACFVIGMSSTADKAFCEECDQWCEEGDGLVIPVKTGGQVKAAKAEGLAGIKDFSLEPSNRFLAVAAQECPGCDESSFYAINEVTVKVDDKGKEDTDTKEVVPLSWKTDADRQQIERINAEIERLASAPDEPEEDAGAEEAAEEPAEEPSEARDDAANS